MAKKAQETKTVYILVRVEVLVKKPLPEDEEVADMVVEDCDYNFVMHGDNKHVEILDTELVWSGDEYPSDC